HGPPKGGEDGGGGAGEGRGQGGGGAWRPGRRARLTHAVTGTKQGSDPPRSRNRWSHFSGAISPTAHVPGTFTPRPSRAPRHPGRCPPRWPRRVGGDRGRSSLLSRSTRPPSCRPCRGITAGDVVAISLYLLQ